MSSLCDNSAGSTTITNSSKKDSQETNEDQKWVGTGTTGKRLGTKEESSCEPIGEPVPDTTDGAPRSTPVQSTSNHQSDEVTTTTPQCESSQSQGEGEKTTPKEHNNTPVQDDQSEIESGSDIASSLTALKVDEEKLENGGPLVKHLSEKELDQICAHLDESTISSKPKFMFIVEKRFEDLLPDQRNQKIRDLCTSNHGMKFLDVLSIREQNLTRGDFCGKASELKRNDIKVFLEKKLKSDDSKLSDLNLEDKVTLASMLSMIRPAVVGWRHFADEYDFSSNDKKEIENVGNSSYNSPSRVLLTKEDVFNTMPLSKLKQLCEHFNFNNTANIIGEIIKKKKEKKKREGNREI